MMPEGLFRWWLGILAVVVVAGTATAITSHGLWAVAQTVGNAVAALFALVILPYAVGYGIQHLMRYKRGNYE